jgi:hypothetical protein
MIKFSEIAQQVQVLNLIPKIRQLKLPKKSKSNLLLLFRLRRQKKHPQHFPRL